MAYDDLTKRTRYLQFLPVGSPNTANLLTEATWQVFNAVKNSKVNEGINVNEIVERTELAGSTVHRAVQTLYQIGFIRKAKQPGREPSRYHECCQKYAGFRETNTGVRGDDPWGDIIFTPHYFDNVRPLVRNKLDTSSSNLIKDLLNFVRELYRKNMKNIPEDIRPTQKKCSECNISHERREFCLAILLQIAVEAFELDECKYMFQESGSKGSECD